MSTAHDVRAQSRKEESNYELAILAAASLSASLCIAGAEIVVFHIVLILATSKIALLLAATIATSMLATFLALAGTSWRLLAKILALVMTSATHIPLEIIVLHSVICHLLSILPCSMVLSSAFQLFNHRAIYYSAVNRTHYTR
jgi:hypothetical protein